MSYKTEQLTMIFAFFFGIALAVVLFLIAFDLHVSLVYKITILLVSASSILFSSIYIGMVRNKQERRFSQRS